MWKGKRAQYTPEIKIEAVRLVRAGQSVGAVSQVLGVSPSGYHERFRRRASPQRRKRLSNDALLVHIKAIHTEVRGEYGWPRIWKVLSAKGIRVGNERVRKFMALHGIKARAKKKHKATTDSKHGLTVPPNLLGRQFTVDAPNRVWTSDSPTSTPARAGCTWPS